MRNARNQTAAVIGSKQKFIQKNKFRQDIKLQQITYHQVSLRRVQDLERNRKENTQKKVTGMDIMRNTKNQRATVIGSKQKFIQQNK